MKRTSWFRNYWLKCCTEHVEEMQIFRSFSRVLTDRWFAIFRRDKSNPNAYSTRWPIVYHIHLDVLTSVSKLTVCILLCSDGICRRDFRQRALRNETGIVWNQDEVYDLVSFRLLPTDDIGLRCNLYDNITSVYLCYCMHQSVRLSVCAVR